MLYTKNKVKIVVSRAIMEDMHIAVYYCNMITIFIKNFAERCCNTY